MNPDEFENGSKPLLDDDEDVDFLLVQSMAKKNGRRPWAGCLGVSMLAGQSILGHNPLSTSGKGHSPLLTLG
ncbi:hypothetical protein [Desulfobulbus elongatus]|uniref:hypothetical protein n=1 Tax=Desulfobulbus elongatus TaxID=53332 RepID=UPI000487D49E|nr:hypothetical protein [Desulfobulbus elongatus]